MQSLYEKKLATYPRTDTNDPDIVLAVASRRPIDHPRALNIGFRPDVEKCYAADRKSTRLNSSH